ncbi:MAG: class I adenylate-forming enzyme family protein [Cyclobacteriaceae bacterium]
MNFFFKDIKADRHILWEVLVNDINASLTYNQYCKSADFYEVFKNIIISMIFGKEVILLDSDFTESELMTLTGYSEYTEFTELLDRRSFSVFNSKEELVEKLSTTSDDWRLTLFTSGTTGIPKKISHNFNSITRFITTTKSINNIWGFAYNPTHMAGVQVFFQALLNGDAIVRLFNLTPNEIQREIKENHITHVSATPTFYRLLLSSEETFPSVLRITSGGEKFSKAIAYQLQIKFPNAKITNIYASTEAGTLFASSNDVFSIKPEFEHLIKVENKELLIHCSLLGKLNTNIKEWYKTGDLVENISEKPLKIRFISRKSDTINIGGYKVNPLEVEEIILSLPGIKNARVYSQTNSVLGNIICSEIVCENKEITESSIRKLLQAKIQEYKIPRIIKFVNYITTTKSGKLERL